MMGDMSSSFFLRFWRVVRIPLLVLVIAYVALVIYRIPAVGEQERTKEAIERIESTRLTMRDVDGSRLPPQPDIERNNETIAGIDANNNKIRDDVELEIFESYPGKENEKIRAALLQYAMGLQLYLTEVFNKETWRATRNRTSDGFLCVTVTYFTPTVKQELSIAERGELAKEVNKKRDTVEELVLNTEGRANLYEELFKFTKSGGSDSRKYCDVFPEEN